MDSRDKRSRYTDTREQHCTARKKRVFISYGHDEHASLAIRLRDDLKARGHKVWFDSERLQPGHDWEIFIEKGLEHLAADKQNAAVLLLMTPHSVRRPDGYCLNEIARALSRGIMIIPLMVVESEPPLSICRIHWLDMRGCIPINEKEEFYGPKLERLLLALEEDQLDFEGTQQRLLRTLQPLEFEADILRHLSKFTGRKWVFQRIDKWLRDTKAQRVFWISGGPGVGKTALSAVLSSRYKEIAALHLCKFGHLQKSDPCCVVTSIAYQLSTQLPEYETLLATMDVEKLAHEDSRTAFDNLILQPAAKLNAPHHVVVILIDALDEATHEGRNELAAFIAAEFDKTPKWMRLIITSRPDTAVTGPLQGLNPFVLETDTGANRSDLRKYLHAELASMLVNHPNGKKVVENVIARSEGVFLYAECVCGELQQGRLSLDRLGDFPQGLGGIFWQFFERQFRDMDKFHKGIRPALRAILAAREPLPVKILQQIFDWQDEELRDFIQVLGALFPVANQNGQDVIRPFHKSLADWLTDEGRAGIYFVSPIEGHRVLAEYGWRTYLQGPYRMPPYVLIHLAAHLLLCGSGAQARRLGRDNTYLSVLESRGDLERAIGVYTQYEKTFRQANDHEGLHVSLYVQALILKARGRLDLALSLLNESETICRRSGNLDGLQASLGIQANILSILGDSDGAVKLLKEAEHICLQNGNLDGLQASLGNQAAILFSRGDLDGALELMKEQENACRQLGNMNSLQASIGNQALVLGAKGDVGKAIAVMKKQELICRRSGNLSGLANSLANQASILGNQNSFSQALSVLKKEERLHRQLGNLESLQQNLGRQGITIQALGELNEAMSMFKEQEQICQKLRNLDGLQRSLGNQANLLYSNGDLDGALALYKIQEKVCRNHGNLNGLQTCLGNQAMILEVFGQRDNALVLQREKEQICRKANNLDGLQASLGSQSVILKAQGFPDEAMELMKERERICRQSGNMDGLQQSLGNQAGIHFDRGELGVALTLYREKEQICRRLVNVSALASSLANQASILANLGRSSEGLSKAEEAFQIASKQGHTGLVAQIESILNKVRQASEMAKKKGVS